VFSGSSSLDFGVTLAISDQSDSPQSV